MLDAVNAGRNLAKNDIHNEIIRQFFLAGIPIELDEIGHCERVVNGMILTSTQDHDSVIRCLVNFLTPNIAPLVCFGISAKNAASAMNELSKSIDEVSINFKRKKNWKAKTIWDRVGR